MSFSVDALASPPMHDAYQIVPFRKEEKQEEREERECDAQTRLHQPEKIHRPLAFAGLLRRSCRLWTMSVSLPRKRVAHTRTSAERGAIVKNVDFMTSVWQRWMDDKTKRKPPVPTDNQIDEVPGKSILLALLQAPPSRQEKTKHTLAVFFFSKREKTQTVE